MKPALFAVPPRIAGPQLPIHRSSRLRYCWIISMSHFSSLIRVLLLALGVLSASACQRPSIPSTTPILSMTDPTTGIHVEVSQQDSLPALKVLLPGQPASDPGILVLFPEHVTALE